MGVVVIPVVVMLLLVLVVTMEAECDDVKEGHLLHGGRTAHVPVADVAVKGVATATGASIRIR